MVEKLVMTNDEAIAALEAAGIKVTIGTNDRGNRTVRIYESKRDGSYMVLKRGYRTERWADYPRAEAGPQSTRLSGGFVANATRALDLARLEREKAAGLVSS